MISKSLLSQKEKKGYVTQCPLSCTLITLHILFCLHLPPSPAPETLLPAFSFPKQLKLYSPPHLLTLLHWHPLTKTQSPLPPTPKGYHFPCKSLRQWEFPFSQPSDLCSGGRTEVLLLLWPEHSPFRLSQNSQLRTPHYHTMSLTTSPHCSHLLTLCLLLTK